MTGWAFIAAPGKRLRWDVIADESDRGLGTGTTGLERNDVRTHFAKAGIDGNVTDQRYSGYRITAVREAGQKLVAWGIDDAGRVCRLERPQDS